MIKNENLNEMQAQSPQSNSRSLQFSPELQQQMTILNARIGNTNFAYSDLLREVENTLKILLQENTNLKKEITELKAKSEKTNKP